MDGIRAIFEIKTTSCKKLASIRKDKKPLRPHILQATAYALCLGVDHILYFYEDRDFTSHYPILYKIPEEIKETVINKLIALVDEVCCKEEVPPSDKSECMFCTYKAICKEIDELEKGIQDGECK